MLKTNHKDITWNEADDIYDDSIVNNGGITVSQKERQLAKRELSKIDTIFHKINIVSIYKSQ